MKKYRIVTLKVNENVSRYYPEKKTIFGWTSIDEFGDVRYFMLTNPYYTYDYDKAVNSIKKNAKIYNYDSNSNKYVESVENFIFEKNSITKV